MVYYMI